MPRGGLNGSSSSLSGGVGSLPVVAASTGPMLNQASASGLFKVTWTPLAIGVCVVALIALVCGTGYYLWHWFSERKKSDAKMEQVRKTIKKTTEQQTSEEEEERQKAARLSEANAVQAQQLEANKLKSQLDQVKAQYLAQAQMAEEQRLANQREIQHLRQQLQYHQNAHHHQVQQVPSQVQQVPSQLQQQQRQVPITLAQQPPSPTAEDQDMSMDDSLPTSEDAAQQEQQEQQADETQHGSSARDDFMVI